MARKTVIQAKILNWPMSQVKEVWSLPKSIKLQKSGALVIEGGRVVACGTLSQIRKQYPPHTVRWIDRRDYYLFPGMVDIHMHLPQLSAIGRDGYELLPWLQKFIFPTEKKFTPLISKKVAQLFYRHLAKYGTTCSVVYGPAWQESTAECFNVAKQQEARTIIGQTLMDRGSYRKFARGQNATEVLIKETEELVADFHRPDQGLEVAITPRFAISCSEKLMRGAARIAEKNQLVIQTHLSENLGEIQETLKLFPKYKTYTGVYDAMGLLQPRTILGHSIHLSKNEIKLIQKRQSAIGYCPSSNIFLQSGILDLDRVRGLKLAMGSDIAGGHDISMIETTKVSAHAQKALGFSKKGYTLYSNSQHFFMATAAARDVLGIEVGHLNKGAWADFFLVHSDDLDPVAAAVPELRHNNSSEDILSLLLYGGLEAVTETYVGGKKVFKRK